MANNKLEQDAGLDKPLGEAIEQYVALATEEAQDADMPPAPIPEGQTELALFRGAEIRKVMHDDEWWFSIVDVVGAIVESANPRRYWSDLKRQLAEKEGLSEVYDKIVQLPMPGADGKEYLTDAANTEGLFRILQSVRSPKAEPFKQWLAKTGYERILETQNPEIAIKRAILTYQLQGRTSDWIDKRIRAIVTRKELTNEWQKRGITEGKEYAILTNTISTATFGTTPDKHKTYKGLRKGDQLRDHMTDLELIFTMLGEKSTTEIARTRDARGFWPNKTAAAAGGKIAGGARLELEKATQQPVMSPSNFLGSQKRVADPERLTSPPLLPRK
ncbi:MAG TPA: Bro-N domain-containing protein [Reyranella sp.]|nr:Bro-N domain-containing protein [Reyranella sp.]